MYRSVALKFTWKRGKETNFPFPRDRETNLDSSSPDLDERITYLNQGGNLLLNDNAILIFNVGFHRSICERAHWVLLFQLVLLLALKLFLLRNQLNLLIRKKLNW